MRNTLSVWLFAALLLSLPCQAQEPGTATPPPAELAAGVMLAVDAMTVQPCIVQLPTGYDPQRAYPLVLGLHGFRSSAVRFASNWSAFDAPQFIYACPNGPYPVQGSAEQYSWVLLNTGQLEAEERSQRYAVDYAAAAIAALKQQYKVSQVFVLGFSQGGSLAYQLGVENAGTIAGIACLAAPLEGPWISGRTLMGAAGLPVLLGGAAADTVVPLEQVQSARDALSAHGLQVEYFEYDSGHTFSAAELRHVQRWFESVLQPAEP